MIEFVEQSEFGSLRILENHGHRVHDFIYCIQAYEDVSDDKYWAECPCCGLKPKIWVFNNGRSTACGCWNSQYDTFSVCAESIMSVHIRCDGYVKEYDSDALRKNWNEYCATMVNPCSHGDLYLESKW